MPSTTGKSLDELKQMRKDLMSQGKQLSTSKSLGKVEQAIKVANPSGYSAGQVSSAQQNLKLINEPTVSGMPGAVASPTSTGPSDLSLLEKQLSDKQAALVKATSNTNDNPWYSEATRTDKLAKLNDIAQLEISNIQNALALRKETEANRTANLKLVTNDAGDVTIYDISTGQVVNTIKGVGNKQTSAAGTSSILSGLFPNGEPSTPLPDISSLWEGLW